jgi:hypothetical protein
MQDYDKIAEIIEKDYNTVKTVKYLIYVYFLACVAVITLILSLIFGNPISHHQGEESWMGFGDVLLIMLASVIIAWLIGSRQFKKVASRFEHILTEDCDAETFLVFANCGMNKPKPNYERNLEQALRRSYETYCLLGYQACGKFKAAEEFMNTHKGLNRRTVSETKMMAAAERRDSDAFYRAYNEIKEILDASPFKRKTAKWRNKFDFIRAMACEDYEAGLESAKTVKPESRYEEMLYRLWEGECNVGLGRLSEAKECFKYVSENGNTLFAKRKAEKYLNEVLNRAPEKEQPKESE